MSLRFDPEFERGAAWLTEEPETVEVPPVGDVAGRRKIVEPLLARLAAARPRPAEVKASDHLCRGQDGEDLLVRWYRKRDATSSGAAVVYLHGGGMIFGSVDSYDGLVGRYVAASGVPMLSVEYRLAPEHPHPTPVEDCYAALAWLHQEAGGLGLDPARIAVMGDSAGGGLAAGVAYLARLRGGPPVARQILVFPMLDDRNLRPDPALEPFAFWTYDDNVTAWRALLGHAAGGVDVDPAAAPARIEVASGLPSAYLEVGQLDIFRDEVIQFADLLSAAAVEVELHLHPGVPHDFDVVAPEAAVSRRAFADRVRVLASL